MLVTLIAAGVIPLEAAAGAGVFDVPPERIAVLANVQGTTAAGVGIPLGAAAWQQPFDPSDHLAFGIDFRALLDSGETIVDIVALTMSSAGAALGVEIDTASGFAPVIDEDTRAKVQLWLLVDGGSQALSSFDASGVQLAVKCRVATTKAKVFERSAVLSVRQL